MGYLVNSPLHCFSVQLTHRFKYPAPDPHIHPPAGKVTSKSTRGNTKAGCPPPSRVPLLQWMSHHSPLRGQRRRCPPCQSFSPLTSNPSPVPPPKPLSSPASLHPVWFPVPFPVPLSHLSLITPPTPSQARSCPRHVFTLPLQ